MPVNNLMYSVLDGQTLPEINGYKFHSDIPEENSNIDISRINEEMATWLQDWQSAHTERLLNSIQHRNAVIAFQC